MSLVTCSLTFIDYLAIRYVNVEDKPLAFFLDEIDSGWQGKMVHCVLISKFLADL